MKLKQLTIEDIATIEEKHPDFMDALDWDAPPPEWLRREFQTIFNEYEWS